jgi:hypothetical protein
MEPRPTARRHAAESSTPSPGVLVLRRAKLVDYAHLRTLAAREARELDGGEYLVVETRGRVVAGIATDGSHVLVADASPVGDDVRALLEMHVAARTASVTTGDLADATYRSCA